jgi:diphthine synthase
MNPHTAFQQILLTENERYPVTPPLAGASGGAGEDTSRNTSTTSFSSTTTDPRPPRDMSHCPPDRTLAISLSRMGTPTQRLISGTLAELASLPEEEFGGPLHTVVIVGRRLHPLEMEYAGRWCVGGEQGGWWKVGKEVYGVERERNW